MVRTTTVSILLATSVSLFTACGGKSKQPATTPVAEAGQAAESGAQAVGSAAGDVAKEGGQVAAEAGQTAAEAGQTAGQAASSAGQTAGQAASSAGQTAGQAASSAGAAASSTGSEVAHGIEGSTPTPSSPSTSGTPDLSTTSPDRQPVSGTEPGSLTPATGTEHPSDTGTATTGEAAKPKITQETVLASFGAHHDAEIALARLGVERASNKSVKKFAKQMQSDHIAFKARGDILGQRLNLTPEDNERAEKMRTESAEQLDKLRALSGSEFDTAFVDQVIQNHQRTLDMIDQTYKPQAMGISADLTTRLDTFRASVAKHLAAAEKLQAKLAK